MQLSCKRSVFFHGCSDRDTQVHAHAHTHTCAHTHSDDKEKKGKTHSGTGCKEWWFALSSASMETGKQRVRAQTRKRCRTHCLCLHIFRRRLIHHSALFFFVLFLILVWQNAKKGREGERKKKSSSKINTPQSACCVNSYVEAYFANTCTAAAKRAKIDTETK